MTTLASLALTNDADQAGETVPLVVDVDGTLLRTDLLQEAALQLIARSPLETPRVVLGLLHGKAALKARLADRGDPGIDTVPLREEVLALIVAARSQGRRVYLASASDRRYVEALGERIGGIAGIFATDGEINLAGEEKARRLLAEFGPRGFDYVGDSPVDFPVWRAAGRVLVVAHDDRFAARVRREFPQARILANPRSPAKAYIRAMRPHQWAKNSLLFLSLIAGHHFDVPTIMATLAGFVCFCLSASSAYIINDLLDLPGDRAHPHKRARPFAAGDVAISRGVVLSAALMGMAIGLSLLLPLRFILILGTYVLATLGYSLVLKRRVILDVITLGGLYTLRVFAGLAASTTSQSQWLLMFSLFIFLSLAIVKRCSELGRRREEGETATVGRGYRVVDLAVLFPLAAAAGYGAVFVIALYLSSPEVIALYTYPRRLWLLCPIFMYWISRVLVLANRGDLHEDPVVFALTDKISWLVGAMCAAVIAVSI